MIRELDVEKLRQQFNQAEPFRHVVIDDFLDADAALEAARSFPSFEEAAALGNEFKTVNELRKLQLTNREHFPEPLKKVGDALASESFRQTLSAITGIENLIWDPNFDGGGIHQTARTGILDVHVDFNYLEDNRWFRRLNLLLYLNERWDPEWGGVLELWNSDVTQRHQALLPLLNRCVVFETSEISFHGVTAVNAPEHTPRRSFACYYYTLEQPEHFSGTPHSTIFKARPSEPLKKYVLMPAEKVQRRLEAGAQVAKKAVKERVKSLLGE